MVRSGNAPWHAERLVPAGTSQSDATAIPALSSPALVVAAGNYLAGIRLPGAAKGKTFMISNTGVGGFGVLFVYPAVGDGINALGINVVMQMPPQTSALFIAADSASWFTNPTVPS